jgi:hypothetical protein
VPIFNIIEGWKKYLQGEVTELEKKRAEICKACPHAVVGSYEKLMPDFELKEIQGLKCDVCKCPLSTKLRANDEKCPLGKW